MKKIIVTGSCGFIGFNLINNIDKNTEVIGLDSLNNAYDNRFKELRLKYLKKNRILNFIKLICQIWIP